MARAPVAVEEVRETKTTAAIDTAVEELDVTINEGEAKTVDLRAQLEVIDGQLSALGTQRAEIQAQIDNLEGEDVKEARQARMFLERFKQRGSRGGPMGGPFGRFF